MTRFEALRVALRTHGQDHASDVTDPAALMVSADAIVAARLGVYQLLQEQGWTPPAGLARQMTADAILLDEQDDRLQTG